MIHPNLSQWKDSHRLHREMVRAKSLNVAKGSQQPGFGTVFSGMSLTSLLWDSHTVVQRFRHAHNVGDLLTPLSLHANDLVFDEHASVSNFVVTPPNAGPLTAPFLFSRPFAGRVPALSAPSQRDSAVSQADDGNTLVVTLLGGQVHCLFVKRCCSQL